MKLLKSYLIAFLFWFILFEPATAGNKNFVFYVGTYTNGESEGIYKYLLEENGNIKFLGLVAKTENPSFLTFTEDEKYLLAVNELTSGTVTSFKVNPDSLISISKSPSGGKDPCHVMVNQEGDVLVSNYSSGTLGLLHIDDKGLLSGLLYVEDHNSEGVIAHTHSAQFINGSDTVISADLGTNELWFSILKNDKLGPANQKTLEMPDNSGPRHFVQCCNGRRIYVVSEFGNTVTFIEKEGEKYKVKKSFPTLPKGFKGKSYSADIHFSPNGEYLYTSNRGHNSIAVFKVDEKSGFLKLIETTSVHGNFPRNFSISPDGKYLLVANQKSGNIVVFKRNNKTGKLNYVSEIKSYTPVCILFKR